MAAPKINQKIEAMLVEDAGRYSKDPLGWVRYAFEWGKCELEKHPGPDAWAVDVLTEMGRQLRSGATVQEAVDTAVRVAVASGHGIGKSAFVSWIILWSLSTFENTKGIVTANTEKQLMTKTWPELAKWHRLCLFGHWFTYTATAIFAADPVYSKTWRFDAIPWSENNTEAFAGLHNQGKRIVLIFDEASAIADKVWEVAEGALTDQDTEIIWCAFGNPTRNTGRFRECFRRFRHRWFTKEVDSRTVRITNKKQIEEWIQDYGLDSDFVKVRVRGIFPSSSDRQFIPQALVDQARGRNVQESAYIFAPKILSCDPAWYGDDEIVIGLRQGLAYRQLAVYRKNDNDFVIAGYLAKFEDEHQADAVFIDQGYGTGIFSAGKEMNRKWTLVPFAGASNDVAYLNKRAEMWGLMKDWLREGGCIPDDSTLCDEISAPEYVVRLDGKIKLESKDDMKKRGLSSPNRADALALTFAMPVVKKKQTQPGRGRLEFARSDYDIFK